MDNTTNGQDQGTTITSQPSTGTIPVQLQNPVGQQSGGLAPSPLPQSVQQPMRQPVSPTSVQQGEPSSSPRITLEDLYGPSGFTDAAPSLPAQPANTISTSAVTQQPIQNPPQQAAVVQPSPPSSPLPAENLPTSNMPIPAVNIPTGLLEQKPSVEPVPTEPLKDLPMRPQRGDISLAPEIPVQQEQTSSQNTSVSDKPQNEKPDKGLNRLMIFRILFGIIAGSVALVVILFAVTWLSALFHPVAASKVTLTYWGLWEDSNTMQVAITQFEQKYPNITVTYEKEDPKQYTERLLTRMQQGNGPDIFIYHSSWLPLVQSDLVPLPTSVISKNDLQNNFYPVVRTDLVKNGALYGIPLEVDTLSLFVNNALLQAAKATVPTTWDTFGSLARALTQKDANGKIKIAGAALGTYDNITHAPDILSALFLQNGVDITTLSPKSNASDALSFYTSFASGDSNVWDNTLDSSQLAFAKGNLAMYFGYSWDVLAIKAANPTLDFSVHPIPHLPGRNTTAASYWVEGVSAKSVHQKEALLFMQFLAQKNTEGALFAEEAKTRLFGEPYARSDLGITLKSNPLVYPFVEQANDASSSFFAGETFDTVLNGQMNGYLGNAVRSVLNNTSPDTAVDTLIKGVQQIESQYAAN